MYIYINILMDYLKYSTFAKSGKLMDIMIFLIVSGLIGWSTSRYMHTKGKNPYLWFAVGTLSAAAAMFLLKFLPFGAILILLGFYLFYYRASERKPAIDASKKDPNTIEVKAERVDPLSNYNKHEWYYLDGQHQQHGPISFHELKTIWAEQKITSATFIWNDTMNAWKRISDVNELHTSLNS